MHYVLALWFEKKIKPKFKGESHIIIYADDYVCCFQYREEAELFYKELLSQRINKFGLELEQNKTRLIEFGRYAQERNTFDFLGFTLYSSKSKRGWYTVKAKTANKKYNKKIKEYNEWLKTNRTLPIKNIIQKTNEKLRGHYQYFGITNNSIMINKFKHRITKIIFKWLNKRSQKRSYTWEEFNKRLEKYPITNPRITVNIYDK